MICKLIGDLAYMVEAAAILYCIEWWKDGFTGKERKG